MESKINYENLDIYSKRICFFYNNQEKITSYFGLFLTFVYIFASLILFLLEVIKAIQRKEIKVYDTTIYSQEMPIIDVDIKQFYFAFGLEYPNTATRYIDEGIYTAKITYFDKQKRQDDFVTVVEQDLAFEKCKVDNFGKDYQNLFVKDELNNSYCLKDFNYNITLAGSYKYERITYLRIVINPCVNSTKNNYSCKPQEEIDKRLNSGYFSIVLKDFGLNPSNYSSPRIPTLQDLYTTVDRRLSKNYILNFGVTEIHTDRGIINSKITKEKYIQFRKVLETFSLRDEKDYHSGKNIILVQLRLEDTLFVQTRAYTKIAEILSKIGGYMQLMNTVFLLLTSFINKINSEIKIINSIFNFNIKENKMILKLKTFRGSSKILNITNNFNNVKKGFSSNIVTNNNIENENKSKNNLIMKDNTNNNISSLNAFDNIKNRNNNNTLKRQSKIITFENSKNDSVKSGVDNIIASQKNDNQIERGKIRYIYSDLNNINNLKEDYNFMDYNDYLNLNIFDYICPRKNSKKYKNIKLFNRGNAFYRRKMDIVNVFTLLTVVEDSIKNISK
jgi:hypothetical protein